MFHEFPCESSYDDSIRRMPVRPRSRQRQARLPFPRETHHSSRREASCFQVATELASAHWPNGFRERYRPAHPRYLTKLGASGTTLRTATFRITGKVCLSYKVVERNSFRSCKAGHQSASSRTGTGLKRCVFEHISTGRRAGDERNEFRSTTQRSGMAVLHIRSGASIPSSVRPSVSVRDVRSHSSRRLVRSDSSSSFKTWQSR